MESQTANKQSTLCVFKFNCSNLPAAFLLVNVTGNALTTTFTQLQSDPCVMMMGLECESTPPRTQPRHSRRRPQGYGAFFFHTVFRTYSRSTYADVTIGNIDGAF